MPTDPVCPQMIAAEAPHPSKIILEELETRNWDRWTLAHRMGGDAAQNRLVIDLYFEVGPGDTNLRLGEATARQVGDAFGMDPEVFVNLEATWLAANAKPRPVRQ